MVLILFPFPSTMNYFPPLSTLMNYDNHVPQQVPYSIEREI